MNKTFYVCLLVGFGFCLGGCGSKQAVVATEPICVAAGDTASAMQACEDVLGELQFVIEKLDVDSGVIRTRGLTGGQFFEFWRRDNVGAENAAMSSIHSVQRVAEMSVSQKGANICIDCNVQVRRLAMESKEDLSMTRAPGMFSGGSTTLQKLKLTRKQQEGMVWVELGRDPLLEQKILELVNNKIVL